MPAIPRRALLAAALLPALPAKAEEPERPVRVITPFPAGATSDSAVRAIGRVMAERHRRPLVTDNRPGAGGGIGAQLALAARPDGQTLLAANNAVLSMVPRLSGVRFDPTRDFEPVAFLGDSYNLLAIAPALGAEDLHSFARLARRRPGELVYASPGIGSYGHVAGELLQRRLGISLLHAPFNGIVPAINAVLAGQAHVVMGPNTLAFAQSGKLRGVAVMGAHRWPDVPEVPTLPELEVADWPLDFWYAVVAPAGTPLPQRQRLHAEFAEALGAPDVAPLLGRLGLRAAERSLEEIGAGIARDWAAMGEALREIGVA